MMKVNVQVIIAAVLLASALAKQDCGSYETNAFEVIEKLRHTFTGFSSDDNDTSLLCSTADLTYYNEEAGELQYTLHVPGITGEQKKDVILDYSKTTSPDELTLIINNDTDNKYRAQSLYSDFKTCSVFKYYGKYEKCTMWVARGYEDEVPDVCIHEFNCACGPAVPLYIQQICKK